LPPQYDHLMTKNSVLCLAPSHRSEWREKDGEEQPDQCDHQPMTLLDSSARTSWMKLSAGTTVLAYYFGSSAGSEVKNTDHRGDDPRSQNLSALQPSRNAADDAQHRRMSPMRWRQRARD
jgi:hypothetical protein